MEGRGLCLWGRFRSVRAGMDWVGGSWGRGVRWGGLEGVRGPVGGGVCAERGKGEVCVRKGEREGGGGVMCTEWGKGGGKVGGGHVCGKVKGGGGGGG